jgi:membrane protein
MRDSVGILREVLTRFQHDRALSQGAALAYYAVFSIAPLLVLVIAVAGMALGRVTAEGEIVRRIREIVGPEGASTIDRHHFTTLGRAHHDPRHPPTA